MESLKIVKREMEKAATNGLNSRPQWNFSRYEKSIGFAAFIHWFVKGITLRNNGLGIDYFEAPNVSARAAATELMLNYITLPPISTIVASKLNSFNPDQEAELCITQPKYGSPWDSSLTRSTIILCREMSYLLTGVLGEKLDVPNDLDFVEAGRVWLKEDFGSECAERLLGNAEILNVQEKALV